MKKRRGTYIHSWGLKSNRRSQANLEFLFTYSWVILFFLGILGALWYFGFLSPQRHIAGYLLISPPFSVLSWQVSPGIIFVEIYNSGENYDILDFEIEKCGNNNTLIPINAYETKTFSVECNPLLKSGIIFQSLIDITYKKRFGYFNQSSSGKVLEKIRYFVECIYGSWNDVECGYGECDDATEMYQSRDIVNGSLCFDNQQCIFNPKCSECIYDGWVGQGCGEGVCLAGELFVNRSLIIGGAECIDTEKCVPITNCAPPLATIHITNCVDLQNIKNNLSRDYVLINDIDCSDTINWNNGSGFEPIGNHHTNPFNGTLYGRYNTITNLFINRPSTGHVGLFGHVGTHFVWDGDIMDVGLSNVDITGYSIVGGLVGTNIGTIKNSYVTGKVNGTFSVGGLVGRNYDGKIYKSYSTATITGREHVGGLVGRDEGGGTIKDCYATGSVTGTSSPAGGLISYNHYAGKIINSYATGNVIGTYNVGGLVGYNHGNISNSYATGSVSRGGFNAGGLVGYNQGIFANILNSYWNNHGGNPNVCVGTNSGHTNNCITIQDNISYFQGDVNNDAPMSSWSFYSIWQEKTDDFPYLI